MARAFGDANLEMLVAFLAFIRTEAHQPVSAKTLALELAADVWLTITRRDGSNNSCVLSIGLPIGTEPA